MESQFYGQYRLIACRINAQSLKYHGERGNYGNKDQESISETKESKAD